METNATQPGKPKVYRGDTLHFMWLTVLVALPATLLSSFLLSGTKILGGMIFITPFVLLWVVLMTVSMPIVYRMSFDDQHGAIRRPILGRTSYKKIKGFRISEGRRHFEIEMKTRFVFWNVVPSVPNAMKDEMVNALETRFPGKTIRRKMGVAAFFHLDAAVILAFPVVAAITYGVLRFADPSLFCPPDRIDVEAFAPATFGKECRSGSVSFSLSEGMNSGATHNITNKPGETDVQNGCEITTRVESVPKVTDWISELRLRRPSPWPIVDRFMSAWFGYITRYSTAEFMDRRFFDVVMNAKVGLEQLAIKKVFTRVFADIHLYDKGFVTGMKRIDRPDLGYSAKHFVGQRAIAVDFENCSFDQVKRVVASFSKTATLGLGCEATGGKVVCKDPGADWSDDAPKVEAPSEVEAEAAPEPREPREVPPEAFDDLFAAAMFIREASSYVPDYRWYLLLFDEYLGRQDKEAAEEALKAALEAIGKKKETHNMAGKSGEFIDVAVKYGELGMHDKGLSLIAEKTASDPNRIACVDPMVCQSFVRGYARLGDLALAENILERGFVVNAPWVQKNLVNFPHELLLGTELELADQLAEAGEKTRAVAHLRHVEQESSKVYGPVQPLFYLSQAATRYQKMGMHLDAVGLAKKTMDRCVPLNEFADMEMEVLISAASTLGALGDKAAAAVALSHALKKIEAMNEEYYGKSTNLLDVASGYGKAGFKPLAREYMQKARSHPNYGKSIGFDYGVPHAEKFARQRDLDIAALLLVDAQRSLLKEYLAPDYRLRKGATAKGMKPSGNKELDESLHKLADKMDQVVDDLFERYKELRPDKAHRLAEGLVKCAAVYEKYGIQVDDEAKAVLKEILEAVE